METWFKRLDNSELLVQKIIVLFIGICLVGASIHSRITISISICVCLFIIFTRLPVFIFIVLGILLILFSDLGGWFISALAFSLNINLDVTFANLQLAFGLIVGSLLRVLLQSYQSRLKHFWPYKLLIKKTIFGNVAKQHEPKEIQGSILGVDSIKNTEVKLTDIDANHHTLAIGTTGTGKTTAISNIVQSAIDRNIRLFYVDGKGDMNLAIRMQDYAKKKNVPFYIFSMLGESSRYNPLASGGVTSKKDRIIELRRWSEEHYRKIAEGYLQTTFALLDEMKLPIDLNTLSRYLDMDELFLLARELKDKNMMDKLTRMENNKKDVSGLVAEIDNLINSEIGHLFDCSHGDVITLEKAYREKAIVYFCLSPLAFPGYAKTLGKLIINDIKSLLAGNITRGKKDIIYTIFDEFSVFAGDQIVNLINQGREAGVCAVLATQSLSDISVVGGQALVGQILNNCNNYIIQRQNNPNDASVLADIIGIIRCI